MTERKTDKREKRSKVKTFAVPFALEEIKESFSTSLNIPTKQSKEQIINQAFRFHSQGKVREAAKYYQYCINQGFIDTNIFSNYGIILKDIGKSKEAEILFRKAIELNPSSAEAHSNLGNVLIDLDQLDEAEISTRKAIEIKPDYAKAHSNLGVIFRILGKLKEAEISTRKAIGLKPDFAEAHSNLGIILNDLGRLEESELSHKKAIKIKPDYADAYFNLSYLELLKGEYKSGLENYEFRFKKSNAVKPHSMPELKRVNHKSLDQGKKLLVISEQSPGDIIFYMRYVLALKEEKLNVSFCAPKKLHSLIKDSEIDSNPISPEECNLINEGEWIPLQSLPRYFCVNPNNPVINHVYIKSKESLKLKWHKILSKEKKPIIGINWQGSKEFELNSYPGRSIPLEKFSIILEKNDISFVSFQKGYGSEQLEHCSFKDHFVECQDKVDEIWDYSETAAIIDNCDLIITIDCSIAPLAAGMGKEVWLMLKKIPFWTWGLESERTFWYPTMRLFRQKGFANWDEVMERISVELNKFIRNKNKF